MPAKLTPGWVGRQRESVTERTAGGASAGMRAPFA
jgi:hypothetical protein